MYRKRDILRQASVFLLLSVTFTEFDKHPSFLWNPFINYLLYFVVQYYKKVTDSKIS